MPLEGEFSTVLEKEMRQWLCEHAPQRASTKIVGSGEYLGVQVGPAADEHSIWRKVAAKWSLR
eukprot:5745345-Pyramimonas_sp.AAC.1